MINPLGRPLLFTTSAGTLSPASIAHDRRSIGINLAKCRASQGRWFDVLRAGDAVHRFLAQRLITTVVGLLAIGIVIVHFA